MIQETLARRLFLAGGEDGGSAQRLPENWIWVPWFVCAEGSIAGATAGVVLETTVYPIDTIKTKLQLVPPVAAKVFVPSVELKVRLRWGEMMKTWLVRVAVDAEIGDMYLRDGWAVFVQANDIHIGDFLSFTYYKEAGVLGVKVFDTTSCRVFYSDAGRSSTHLLKQKGL